MCQVTKKLSKGIIIAVLSFFAWPSLTIADVCSDGVGIPPFLAAGADPNLLMVLDNSGSMLDMAYEDDASVCYDDTLYGFDGANYSDYEVEYAGYYENDAIYTWVEPTATTDLKWQPNTTYYERVYDDTTGAVTQQGSIVFDNGVFYRAVCEGLDSFGEPLIECTSDDVADLDDDTGVLWAHIGGADPWVGANEYDPGSFVKYNGLMYYTALGGTSGSSGPTASPLDGDISDWVVVAHSWLSSATYQINDVVTYEGMVFQQLTGIAPVAPVEPPSSDNTNWKRLDEGYWQEVDNWPCATPSYEMTHLEDPGDVTSETTDLQIELLLADGSPISSVDDTPASVGCFAARGNVLNWASASRFDIEKLILTGGKYYMGYEATDADGNRDDSDTTDDGDDRLITESRGCAGSAFVKEITLDGGYVLTLRIRGTRDEDWVDTLDDTTRIDVLGVTESGFDSDGSCQDAVDKILAGQGGYQSDYLDCLVGKDNADTRPILNHALQYCWQGWNKDKDRSLNVIISKCADDVYGEGIIPATIKPEDDGYNCTGIYDGTLDHDIRDGYVGRCFEIADSGGATCDLTNKNEAATVFSAPSPPCDDGTCEWDWPVATEDYLLRISDSSTYVQYCTQIKSDGSCQNAKKWENFYYDFTSSIQCDPSDATYVDLGSSNWSDVLYPDADGDGVLYPTDLDDTGYNDPSLDPSYAEAVALGLIPNNINIPGYPDFDLPEWWCVHEAMEDYCGSLQVEQVIDPSTLATNTGDLANIPAGLIDSGVLVQLGIDRPLAVYKGFIDYELPDEQKAAGWERPQGPNRVLFDVAANLDLRLGVMAFNNIGSEAECSYIEDTCTLDVLSDPGHDDYDYCQSISNMKLFCPKEEGFNRDGAQVLVQIERGMFRDEGDDQDDPSDDFEDWSHYIDLITEINDVKATSWTPLAEAVYTALGYYGQNDNLRLFGPDRIDQTDENPFNDDPDFFLESESIVDGEPTWPDPVQYWCQENNILIITEGASTADRKELLPIGNAPNTYTGDPDDGDQVCEIGGLEGSTYFDDLTYFGKNAITTGVVTSPPDSLLFTELIDKYEDATEFEKQQVSTYIVSTTRMDNPENLGECTPEGLIYRAAVNGGTAYLEGEDPDKLETSLNAAFAGIARRASAGSAASVISSAKSGKGAVFQAVFWPEVDRSEGSIDDPALTWVGDVHGLFIDDRGYLWDDYSWPNTLPADQGEGVLYSTDTNGNGLPDDGNGACIEGDRRVWFYYDGNDTRICYTSPVVIDEDTNVAECQQLADSNHCGDGTDPDWVEPADIQNYPYYLWSAEQGLKSVTDISINRETVDGNVATENGTIGSRWDWTFKQRYIFTWNDLDNDGIVDSYGEVSAGGDDEIVPLMSVEDVGLGYTTIDWEDRYSINETTTNRVGQIYHDFKVSSSDEMNELIEWLRGSDSVYEPDGVDLNANGVQDYVFRCRRYPDCVDPTSAAAADNPVWRLGDVIHATPKLVAQPAEAFQTIYADASYAFFVKRHRFRRNVVYFGANDGMLHAVNSGYPVTIVDADNNKITRYFQNLEISNSGALCYYNYSGGVTDSYSPTSDSSCTPSPGGPGPELGDELWAYIPYNLQPHLQCLMDPEYDISSHKYYVDKEARIFDMQIFNEEAACSANPYSPDCIHPGGWGTILVGSMRFGGAPVTAAEDDNWPTLEDGSSKDNRQFTSAYFVLDITDPERPPKLLGEMTQQVDTATLDPIYANLGYTTPMPTAVAHRDENGDTTWYLVMGNGPSSEADGIDPLKGENDGLGKLAYLPMSWLTGESNIASTSFSKMPFRIPPSSAPVSGSIPPAMTEPEDKYGFLYNQAGIIDITDADEISDGVPRFTSDLISIDFSLNNKLVVDVGARFETDAVYFGTTDGSLFSNDLIDNSITRWTSGGGVYRLVTSNFDDGFIPNDAISDWPKLNGGGRIIPPGEWRVERLIDTDAPVSGAISVGWDGSNFWVYAGTGRFFDVQDKTDDTVQYFFGIKEPLEKDCSLAWNEVNWSIGNSLSPGTTAGGRGLFRSDYVRVFESAYTRVIVDDPDGGLQKIDVPVVFCNPDAPLTDPLDPAHTLTPYCKLDYTGLTELDSADYTIIEDAVDNPLTTLVSGGTSIYAFEDLRKFIAGERRDYGWDSVADPTGGVCNFSDGIDGWVRVLTEPRERVVGQSTLLGGLTTYTSYVPFDDICTAEGESWLNAVHYQMGTAWHEYVFGYDNRNGSGGSYGDTDALQNTIISDKRFLGRGLATTPSLQTGSGSGADAKAFIQASTGEIIEIEQENLPIKPPESGRVFWNDDRNPAEIPNYEP